MLVLRIAWTVIQMISFVSASLPVRAACFQVAQLHQRNSSWMLMLQRLRRLPPTALLPLIQQQRAASLHQKQQQRLCCSKMSSTGMTTTLDDSKTPPIIPRAAVSVCVQCSIVTSCAGVGAATSSTSSNITGSTSSNQTKQLPPYFYLLVQRGTAPNKGMWSLPGGKIEFGETAMTAAKRELAEETKWIAPSSSTTTATATATIEDSNSNDNDDAVSNDVVCEEDDFLQAALQWYDGTVTTTDSVGEGFHFLIAHCFAELQVVPTTAAVTAAIPLTTAINITAAAADTDDDDNNNNKWKMLLPKIEAADDAADAGWFSLAEIQAMTEERTSHQQQTVVTPGLLLVLRRIEELSRANMLLPTTTR